MRSQCEAWGAAADGEPARTAVFGIGGGLAMDYAKFAAGALKLPLVLVPSILSVDAPFTPPFARSLHTSLRTSPSHLPLTTPSARSFTHLPGHPPFTPSLKPSLHLRA